MFVANGDDSLGGYVGAGGGEVNEKGVVLEGYQGSDEGRKEKDRKLRQCKEIGKDEGDERRIKKLGLLKINDDSFACNSPLGTIYDEFNRLSEMDDDLFTYDVGIHRLSSIPCDKKERDGLDDGIYVEAVIFVYKRLVDVKVKEGVISKWLVRSYKKQFDEYMEIKKQWVTRKIDPDMEYDPSDVEFAECGDDEVELTDKESFDPDDEKDEGGEIFRIKTELFNFETPICKAFNEFNYLLNIDIDLLTNDILRFKTYDEFKMNGWTNGTKGYHGFPRNHGLNVELLLVMFFIFVNLSVSRMGKQNDPLVILTKMDSAMEDNYRG
nr:hypothetical protein [Tanacetum cinerariifolium]